jgi:hypothetical protein
MALNGTCTDVAGVHRGTDQVLVCPEIKTLEGTPSTADVSYNPKFKERHGMQRVQNCAFRK